MNERIKQIYTESNSITNIYNQLLNEYLENGIELEDITNKSVMVQSTLQDNSDALRHTILDSDLCKQLEERGINYSFSDLKAYIAQYGINHDVTLLDKLVKQYETTEQLSKLEEKEISVMSFNLNSMFGETLMSKYNDQGIINSNGQATIEQTLKSPEQLFSDYKKALERTEELYVNEGLLDRNSYMQTVDMINRVYNNYVHGSRKIDVDKYKQMNAQRENTNSFSQ